MNDEEKLDGVLLERAPLFLEPDELVDEDVGFDDDTAQYVLAQVDDDYEEVTVVEPVDYDDGLIEEVDVIPLDEIRLHDRDLEVA